MPTPTETNTRTLAEGVKHIPITATDGMLPATTSIPEIIYV